MVEMLPPDLPELSKPSKNLDNRRKPYKNKKLEPTKHRKPDKNAYNLVLVVLDVRTRHADLRIRPLGHFMVRFFLKWRQKASRSEKLENKTKIYTYIYIYMYNKELNDI